MKKRSILSFLGLVFGASICSPAPLPFPEAVQQIDAMMTRAVKMKMFRGTVLIVKDGKEFMKKGYGEADAEWGIPNTPHTKFRLASTTRQFTAAAILLLEAEGKLSVQDPIARFIDRCPAEWQGITIHQLLSHTAGIPALREFQPSVEQSVALMREGRLEFTPGER